LSVLSPKIFEAHEIGQNLSEESVSTGNPVFESGVRDFARYTMKVARRWIVPEKIA
jgi:hypothetical protein